VLAVAQAETVNCARKTGREQKGIRRKRNIEVKGISATSLFFKPI
jgi:hypothetical protein